MPSTPNLALPYPALSDVPDVPYWLQQITQAVDALGAAWTAYTPTWTASTPPVIGNGSIDAAYLLIGKLAFFRCKITMGSTTTFGSGQWNIGMPYPPKTDKIRFADSQAYDSSANAYYPAAAMWNNPGSLSVLWTPGTTAGGPDRAINATTPFTWAQSDQMIVRGLYERA